LEYFVSLSFNWTRIAAILGISRMTVYCRRQEFGMLDEPRTNVSDGELLVLVEDIRKNEPEMWRSDCDWRVTVTWVQRSKTSSKTCYSVV